MKLFRKIIFWAHLVVGLAAGLVIAVMAFTGASMAFEKEVIAWAERDARQVSIPTDNAERVPLDQIIRDLRETQPDLRIGSITVSSDPRAAIILTPARGRGGNENAPRLENQNPSAASSTQQAAPAQTAQRATPTGPAVIFVNPYTGEVIEGSAQKTRAFFQLMLRWHRWLGFQDQPQRATASQVTGAACAIFFFLAVSGLYLWWPRNWNWRTLKGISVFNAKLSGKARDWNWHNVIGLWSSPILIITTFTGLVMAYRWIGDTIYKRPEGEGPGGAANVQIVRPEGARPLGSTALFEAAQKATGGWEQITIRLNTNQRARGGQGGMQGQRREGMASTDENRPREGENTTAPGGESRERRQGENQNRGNASPQPISVSVVERGSWSPLPLQLSLNPYTGEVLKQERLSDFPLGRAFRSLNRSIHTGEAGGIAGQTLSMLAALGALVLVYTGFALAFRRFFGRKRPSPFTTDSPLDSSIKNHGPQTG